MVLCLRVHRRIGPPHYCGVVGKWLDVLSWHDFFARPFVVTFRGRSHHHGLWRNLLCVRKTKQGGPAPLSSAQKTPTFPLLILRAIGCCGRAGYHNHQSGVQRAIRSRCGVMVRPEEQSPFRIETNIPRKETTGSPVSIEHARNISRSCFGDFVGSDFTDSAMEKVLSGMTELRSVVLYSLPEWVGMVRLIRLIRSSWAGWCKPCPTSRCCNDAWPLRFTALYGFPPVRISIATRD
jgi:hypothetical protein